MEELGEGTVHFMRMIKKAVDPLGLFNPGKVSKLLSHFSVSIINHTIMLVISRHIKAGKEIIDMAFHKFGQALAESLRQ